MTILQERFGENAWTSVDEILTDPYKKIIACVRQMTRNVSSSVDEISKRKDVYREQLRFAGGVADLLGLDVARSKTLASVGLELLCRVARTGNTIDPLAAFPVKAIVESSEFVASSSDDIEVVSFSGQSFVALSTLLQCERECARRIIKFSRRRVKLSRQSREISGARSDEQVAAVGLIRSRSIVVLTGGAGTGKTATIKEIIATYTGVKWLLLAPTGKAVDRLKKAVGYAENIVSACTVSKFLWHQSDDPISYSGLIVDEVGFLGVEQFNELLGFALKNRAMRMVLVGDEVQLPSIGPGAILSDLISCSEEKSSLVGLARLTFNFRAESDGLSQMAESIRGARSWSKVDLGDEISYDEFSWDDVEEQVLHKYRQWHRDGVECQVIAPTNQLVDRLNSKIQDFVCSRKPALSSHGEFRVGDRIICVKNLYEPMLTVLNGQIFSIVEECEDKIKLRDEVSHEVISLACGEMSRFQLGYAISIHRAQGSQWSAVIAVVPNIRGSFISHAMIYTAVTRAQHHLALIASTPQLRTSMANRRPRQTALARYLKAMLSGRPRGPFPRKEKMRRRGA